ncbi:hypothetical protein [Agrococcus baldri]|uniref:Uncharacterized protein n=1 Tax=Agrococcus baldri TaxID=153730 RepID=A0AA87RAL6_9MICO|nr:hypothetical protein [Agrococcus baldri]GEK79520.1 hypothetical protein ABA31_08710 [Agrococcus baldri]
MRSFWNAIVNWVAALFASITGAPHPIVATDPVADAEAPASGREPRRD